MDQMFSEQVDSEASVRSKDNENINTPAVRSPDPSAAIADKRKETEERAPDGPNPLGCTREEMDRILHALRNRTSKGLTPRLKHYFDKATGRIKEALRKQSPAKLPHFLVPIYHSHINLIRAEGLDLQTVLRSKRKAVNSDSAGGETKKRRKGNNGGQQPGPMPMEMQRRGGQLAMVPPQGGPATAYVTPPRQTGYSPGPHPSMGADAQFRTSTYCSASAHIPRLRQEGTLHYKRPQTHTLPPITIYTVCHHLSDLGNNRTWVGTYLTCTAKPTDTKRPRCTPPM
ncbi:MAG: hypothetical protein Q9221_001018 [Calogaya cf. arnoldii]